MQNLFSCFGRVKNCPHRNMVNLGLYHIIYGPYLMGWRLTKIYQILNAANFSRDKIKNTNSILWLWFIILWMINGYLSAGYGSLWGLRIGKYTHVLLVVNLPLVTPTINHHIYQLVAKNTLLQLLIFGDFLKKISRIFISTNHGYDTFKSTFKVLKKLRYVLVSIIAGHRVTFNLPSSNILYNVL